MKKIILNLTAILSLLAIVSCEKRKIEAPQPDTDVKSSQEAFWALFNITDVEQMVALMGEGQGQSQHFYSPDPSVVPNGSMSATNPNDAATTGVLNMTFNQTHCLDGKFRPVGGVFGSSFYSEEPDVKAYYTLYNIPNTYARFYHDFGFLCRFSFNNYKVNDWRITTDSLPNTNSFSHAVVYNYMGRTYDPRKAALKTRLVGSFVLYHPTDRSQDMTLKCDLVKTVVNSTDPQVFPSSIQNQLSQPVFWNRAKVSYAGKVEGTTSGNRSYRMEISESNPLIRDFTCYPDKVSAAAAGTGTQAIIPYSQEFHPFSSGVVSFTTTVDGKDQYPRQVYFGNEGHLDLAPQCDNSGEIVIKGNSYKVDFWK